MALRCAVVIPCFNHERFVGEAVESVLSQTRPPERFLVVDDGSRDGSVGVLEGYRGRGVELIVQENRGAHAALNRAVETVADDVDAVAILDSDDVFEPTRLERCLAHLADHPDCGVVCTELRVVDGQGAPLPDDADRARWFRAAWSLGRAGDLSLPEWLGMANFPATTSNLVARTEDLRARPFKPYRYAHDYAFLLESALRQRLAVLDEPLLRYRVHGDNTIGLDPAPLVRELLRLQLDLQRDLQPELRTDPALRRRFYAFARASFDNFSSLHAGLLRFTLGELLLSRPPAEVEALLEQLPKHELDELARTPNPDLQREDVREGRSVPRSELLERNARLLETMAEQLRLDAWLLGSRWVALGRVLGVAGDLLPDARGGQALERDARRAPAKRLESQRRRIRASRWVKLGARLGVSLGPAAARPGGAARMNGPRIAYLFARYPVPSQTFCDGEILALEALGLDLEIVATSAPRTTFRHERLAEVRAPVTYLPPQKILRAHELVAERQGRFPTALLADQEQRHGDVAPVRTRVRHALALSQALIARGVAHVHAHFAGHAAHVARLVHGITGIPYSFTAHAQDFMVDVASEELLRELCREAAFVVAVSDWSRTRLQQTCPEASERILRVYNGIEPEDFAAPALHEGHGVPRIVSVGRLIEFKGFHHLIGACGLLRQRGVDFECTLIGDGPWRERLEALAAEAGVASQVHFAGLQSLETVKRTLRESDVFALASVVDGEGACDVLPTVILEAMATGLPVASTRLVGIPEMVEHEVTGLLAEPGDEVGLADALERLLASRDLRRSLGEAGRKRVPERFASTRTAPALQERLLASAANYDPPTPAAPTRVAWLVETWPPRPEERLDAELRFLRTAAPDVAVLACRMDPSFEPTGRGADLEGAAHMELLPDGIVLEAELRADPGRAAELDALRADLPSWFAGEDYYREARRALAVLGIVRRRGVRHLHAARATSMLCAWIAKRLDPELRTSFALDRRTAGSRRAFARLARDLDFGAVADDLLFGTVRKECGDDLPLVTPIPGPPGRPHRRPLRPLRGWYAPARGPALERGVALDAWIERLRMSGQDP